MPCNCCAMENNTFGEDEAKANLKDYCKRGPAKQTKLILEAVRSLGLKGASLLDVGGGIGTIHHELLKDVANQATHVDASSAYLKIATEEAKRLGHEAQVKFIHADFTDVADELLRKGYRVRAIDSLCAQVHGADAGRPDYLDPDVELVVGDVRERPVLERGCDQLGQHGGALRPRRQQERRVVHVHGDLPGNAHGGLRLRRFRPLLRGGWRETGRPFHAARAQVAAHPAAFESH